MTNGELQSIIGQLEQSNLGLVNRVKSLENQVEALKTLLSKLTPSEDELVILKDSKGIPAKYRDILHEYFTEDDLVQLCFNLGKDMVNLRGITRFHKIESLIIDVSKKDPNFKDFKKEILLIRRDLKGKL